MVDNCLTVGIFCVCGALLSLILKQYCTEHSLTVSLAVCTAVLTAFVLMLASPVSELRIILEAAEISEEYISVMFKALAICCITHIASELCRDSGENAMGSAAELWGRGALITISIPVFNAFLKLIEKLL